MKTLIAIVIAISVLIPTVNGTWITDVRWNADLKVIEINLINFPLTGAAGGCMSMKRHGQWKADQEMHPFDPMLKLEKPLGFLLEPIPGFLAWKAQTSLAVALFDFIYLTTVTPTNFRTISLKRDAKRLRQKNVPQ